MSLGGNVAGVVDLFTVVARRNMQQNERHLEIHSQHAETLVKRIVNLPTRSRPIP